MRAGELKYWWVSLSNDVEHEGPFATIDEAKAKVVEAMEIVNDTADVVILQEVARGEVIMTMKWKDKK